MSASLFVCKAASRATFAAGFGGLSRRQPVARIRRRKKQIHARPVRLQNRTGRDGVGVIKRMAKPLFMEEDRQSFPPSKAEPPIIRRQ